MIGAPPTLANRYFLLRHGESLANRQGIIVSLPGSGVSGYGLTPLGRQQVATHVEQAKRDAVWTSVDAIVSSPFLRTLETGGIAAGIVGAPVEVDDRLRERSFGELDGMANENYAKVWARDREDPSHADWGVESAATVLLRARAMVADLEARGSGQTILLTTHGDVASILICGLLGHDLRNHREVATLAVGEVRPLRVLKFG